VQQTPDHRINSVVLPTVIADFCNKIGTSPTFREFRYVTAFGGKADIRRRKAAAFF
jgi:hypothetical protein